MTYTEIQEKNGTKYYYRTFSIREKNGFRKVRKYMGKDFTKQELRKKEAEADKELTSLKERKFKLEELKLYKQSGAGYACTIGLPMNFIFHPAPIEPNFTITYPGDMTYASADFQFFHFFDSERTKPVADELFSRLKQNPDWVKLRINEFEKAINGMEEVCEEMVKCAENIQQNTKNKIIKAYEKFLEKNYSYWIPSLFIDILDTYEESKRNNGLAINRVKDNIKAGECQICSLELKDFNVFINKCCGIILCDECAIKGSHLIKLTAKCPNCDADINFSKDVIFINQEFDINSIVEATGDEHEIKSSHVKDKENNVDPKINPKLKALLDIINGDPPVNKKTVDMSIKQLIIGKSILEPPKYRKVLVFANFNETLHNIEKTLDENSIKYLKLQGTHSKISTIISTFKNSNIHPTVLLINSSEHCAGLNLQFATDLIFFHKIINDNIESQVAGRAQRIGRTSNLNIHFLLYTNEK